MYVINLILGVFIIIPVLFICPNEVNKQTNTMFVES